MHLAQNATLRLTVEPIDAPDNPYHEDSLGIIANGHPRYPLGGPTAQRLPKSFASGAAAFKATIGRLDREVLAAPIYLYDHGLLCLSLNPFTEHADWDSGQVGYLYATKPAIRDWFRVTRITSAVRRRAWDVMTAELADYDTYLRGDVYTWSLEAREADAPTISRWTWVDTSGPYYGTDWDTNGLRESVPPEAQALVDALHLCPP